MASVKAIAKGRSDVYMVRPDQLTVKEGWNGRDPDHPENVAHIDALAQSIAAEGVKEPLAVYAEGDFIYIENGHMRHAASLKAISDYGADPELLIPVRTTPKEASEADRIMSQLTRNSGRALMPLEMAGVFQRLQALGLSDAEIGRRSGLSRVYIGQLIELSKMPKAVTNPVREGTVSATLAIQTMKRFDGDSKKTATAIKDAINLAKTLGKSKATSKDVKKAAAAKGEALPAEKKKDREANANGEAKAAPKTNERVERKSGLTILSEVRTAFETASYEHVTETEEPHVNVSFTMGQFRDLVGNLDLEAYRKVFELKTDELV